MKKCLFYAALLLLPFLFLAGGATAQTIRTPILSITPSSGDYAGVETGTSRTIIYTIRNSGVSVLKIRKIALSGTAFTLSDRNTYPFEVIADSGFAYSEGNSGKTLKISVAFAPLSTGVHTGKITITYGLWSDEVFELPLTGEGVSCNEALLAVKGENHASRQNVWYKYTADKFSIVEVNACHPNQVNPPTNPYRLLYFYVYDGCNGPLIMEAEEWRGLCQYDHEAIPVDLIMKAGQTIYIYFPVTDPASSFAKNGFYFNILATYPTDGDVCENAIPLTLPVVNLFGNTRDLKDDYNVSPCSVYPNYMEGNDAVYTITLPEEGYLTGNILGTYGSIHVLDVCPVIELSRDHCKAFVGGPQGGQFRKKIAAGTYYVIVSNWAPPQTLDYLLNMSWESVSGVETGRLDNNLSVYPNPATGRLNLVLNSEAPADIVMELVDLSGQVVYRHKASASYSFTGEINVQGFARGVYYLRVNNGRESVVRKVVLE